MRLDQDRDSERDTQIHRSTREAHLHHTLRVESFLQHQGWQIHHQTNQRDHSTDLLTISMSSARGPQPGQRQRIIPSPHPLECRTRRAEKGNEVSSKGASAQRHYELEFGCGGGQAPASNRTREHEHFHAAIGKSQSKRSPTMAITLLSNGPFADELPSQNPQPYDPIGP